MKVYQLHVTETFTIQPQNIGVTAVWQA